MPRYSLVIHRPDPEYVAACYEPVGSGLRTTLNPEDACSWVLFEKACEVARHVREVLDVDVSIRSVAN